MCPYHGYGAQGVLASIKPSNNGTWCMCSYESWEDYTPRIIERNGIWLASFWLAYGLTVWNVSESAKYLATLIDKELIPLEIKDLNSKWDVSSCYYSKWRRVWDHADSRPKIATHQLARDGANVLWAVIHWSGARKTNQDSLCLVVTGRRWPSS